MEEKEKCEYCGKEIEEVAEQYFKLTGKYSLPDFQELNEDFDIGKADYNSNTMLREVRKIMISKFASVLQFVELLLNPSNGSMFHMFLVREINHEDKEELKKLFSDLGRIQINSFSLDIVYDEKKEAEFIKNGFEIWKNMKPKLNTINNSLGSGWEKSTSKKEKSYFG